MDLNQASSWRKLVGKTCALFCLLAFLAILDGLIAKFREPVNVFHVLPGDVVNINGPLPENIKRPEALTYVSDSPDLAVAFETIHSGYFMGGNMWRGRLWAGENLPPGKYTVTVRPRDYPLDKPGFQLRVVVYPDALSQRAAFRSIIKRQTGISPFLVAATFLPFIGITLGAVYLLSRRVEVLMAKRGIAEIYHVAREEGHYLFAFGLGSKHGVQFGDRLSIFDPEGHQVGIAEIREISATDSVGQAMGDQDIRPGYIVSLNR